MYIERVIVRTCECLEISSRVKLSAGLELSCSTADCTAASTLGVELEETKLTLNLLSVSAAAALVLHTLTVTYNHNKSSNNNIIAS